MGLGSKITLLTVRRIAKPIPVIGTIVILATALPTIRRKGIWRGGLDLALDALPLIGTAKGAVELFTGDLIDKETALPNPLQTEFGDKVKKFVKSPLKRAA